VDGFAEVGQDVGPMVGSIDGQEVIGADVDGRAEIGQLVSGVEVGVCDGNIDGEAVVGEDVAG